VRVVGVDDGYGVMGDRCGHCGVMKSHPQVTCVQWVQPCGPLRRVTLSQLVTAMPATTSKTGMGTLNYGPEGPEPAWG
jgi:hypothetical protein